MKLRGSIFGCALAVAAAGCAGGMSGAAVPVEPVANGQPTLTTGYEVARQGNTIAHVEVVPGNVVNDQLRVGLRVENASRHSLVLPAGQLWVAGLAQGPVQLSAVNGDTAIGDLTVPAGESQTFALAFALPGGVSPARLQQFTLHWAVFNGANDHVLARRVTGFTRVGVTQTAERPDYTASALIPGGELPGYVPARGTTESVAPNGGRIHSNQAQHALPVEKAKSF